MSLDKRELFMETDFSNKNLHLYADFQYTLLIHITLNFHHLQKKSVSFEMMGKQGSLSSSLRC